LRHGYVVKNMETSNAPPAFRPDSPRGGTYKFSPRPGLIASFSAVPRRPADRDEAVRPMSERDIWVNITLWARRRKRIKRQDPA